MPVWLQAGLWGLVAGMALLVGAAVGYFADVPRRIIAVVMAFGPGVLFSALSIDLMEEAYHRGGIVPAAVGFLGGALVYTGINWRLSHAGAKHRKDPGTARPSEEEKEGSGLALAAGALIDGIPESIVIGTSMIQGGAVGLVTVAAVFLSNVPEGLSSSAGMKKSGRSAQYIFGVWGGIALINGISALGGYTLFSRLPEAAIAGITAVAAGGILAMLASTMIPEAFEETREWSGLITVVGFLLAFALSKVMG